MSVVSGIVGASATKKAAETQSEASSAASGVQLDMYEQSRQDQMPWLMAGKGALADLSGGITYTGERPVREDFYTPGTTERTGLVGKILGATGSENRQFDQAGYDKAIEKYEATGVSKPGMIQGGPGDFAESDYYRQGLEEEEQAINRYLASRGMYASGKAGKALSENALSNMQRNRGNWVNEWIATKLNPTQSLAGVGQSTAANVGQQGMQTGYQVGSNIMSSADAIARGQIGQANILSSTSQSTANAIANYYGQKTAAQGAGQALGSQYATDSAGRQVLVA